MKVLFSAFLILISLASFGQSIVPFSEKEVIYSRKDGMALTMIILQPTRPNGKAFIRLVSGGWNSSYSTAKDYFIKSSAPFLNKGYTVFLTIHSSNPKYTIPDALTDVQKAVQHVRYNAKDYEIDDKNIIISGISSGGHLSLLAAMSKDIQNPLSNIDVEKVSSKVQAVVAFCPLTDFLNFGGIGTSINSIKKDIQSLGVWGAFSYVKLDAYTKTYIPVEDINERRKIDSLASPAQIIPNNAPPVYLIHGNADRTVPIQQSILFAEKYKSMGLESVMVIKPGEDHNLKGLSQKDYDDILEWVDKKMFKE